MTIDYGQANLAVACAFVDELHQRGVRHAVICPGSRSTPLALAFAEHHGVHTWVLVDERSAAYFALGMARQIGEPVAIVTTSGTAAANLHPTIAEARLGRVPLIALTADRPPELRGWGAAQTIDQLRLFGDHVKWFADMPVPEDDDILVRHARAAAARAVQTARSLPAGPVHLNMPFREPLLPTDLRPPLRFDPLFLRGRQSSPLTPVVPAQKTVDDVSVSELANLTTRTPRGIIVCGPSELTGVAAAVTALAQATGYPVLADPLSGIRFGDHDRTFVIDAYDPFLRDEATAATLRPDLVIRVGAIPTSKPLQQFLEQAAPEHHVVVDAGAPRDPSHLATWVVEADPAPILAAIAERNLAGTTGQNTAWIDSWRTIDRATGSAITAEIAGDDDLFEGRALAEVAAMLPDGATLVVGNSMPVRDVDAFVRGDRRSLRILANRGANGIDGVTSSALGAAAVDGGPIVLVVGDLSFCHDLNGLLAAAKFGLDATIVVCNNNGGGIFSFLPQAEQLDPPTFEALFGTPMNLDIAAAARLFGGSCARPETWVAFRQEVCRSLDQPGLGIIELVTDRQRNVARHREVWAAVGAALRTSATDGT